MSSLLLATARQMAILPRMMTLRLLKTTLLLSLAAFPAHAGIGGLGNATVNEGEFSTHLRASIAEDGDTAALDGRFRSRFMADYGFTDDFALGLYVQGDNRNGDSQALEALMLDARFEWAESKTHGYYSGLRLRYTFKDGDKKPDNAHARLILGKPLGRWDFRINQIFAYEIGEGSGGGIGIDTRLQASYHYHPDHRIGVESFSDFGYGSRWSSFDEQNHTAGPVLAGKITDGLTYETGYRYGLSEAAPDHTLKLFVVKTF